VTQSKWRRASRFAEVIAFGALFVALGLGSQVSAATLRVPASAMARPVDGLAPQSEAVMVSEGATQQTIDLPDSQVTITFGTPIADPDVAIPDSYVVQHVSVTDTGINEFYGFKSTISGDWQYDGDYAYVYGAMPGCDSSDAVVYVCQALSNGVPMPHPMVWEDEGFAITPFAEAPYYIDIDLYGSGAHSVSVSGPGKS